MIKNCVIFLLILIPASIYAQNKFRFGPTIGVAQSSVITTQNPKPNSLTIGPNLRWKTGFSAGLRFDLDGGSNFYFRGSLLFNRLGYKFDFLGLDNDNNPVITDTKINARYDNISAPISIAYHLGNENIKFYPFIGIGIDYYLGLFVKTDSFLNEFDTDFQRIVDGGRIGVFGLVGFGAEFPVRSTSVFVELKYHQYMSNVLPDVGSRIHFIALDFGVLI